MQIIYFQIPFKIQLRPLKSLSTLHISGKFFSELLTQDTRYGLNYLMIEATFALPQFQVLSFVYRIHHRSGVFGVIGRGDTNYYTFGLRYRF